jgi:hypothetical protein
MEEAPILRRLLNVARPALFLLLIGGGFDAAIDEANAAEDGRVVARAGKPVPERAVIRVRPDETDNRAVALVEVVAQALAEQGFRTSDDGTMILQFRIAENGIKEEEPNPRIKLHATVGSGSQSRDRVAAEVRVRPFDEPAGKTRRALRIELSLYAPGRPPQWTATVSAPRHEADEKRQLERMIRAAMSAFGKTVERDLSATK